MTNALPRPILFCETAFTPTSYAELAKTLYRGTPDKCEVVDFSNTHITTLRLTDSNFRHVTESVDHFVPDSMPLTWCVNLAAGKTVMPDRVYGPEFMKRCLGASPSKVRHYFLGASEECLRDLITAAKQNNPDLNICGAHHGYFAQEDCPAVVEKIRNANPHIVWVGLGTPKQQEFTDWAKNKLSQVWLLNVGFAFDVNAGHKTDAPKWMQSMGLTWLFRLASEPGRLAPRYAKYNSLFLLYALEWFMTNHWLVGILKKSWLFFGVALVTAGSFITWCFVNLPSSLPYAGLALISLLGAWFGLMLAMAAGEENEEEFAPSTKILSIAALLGVFSALLSILLPVLLATLTPSVQWPAALATAAGAFIAPLFLILLAMSGYLTTLFARKDLAVQRASGN
jgi:N-acetylglucosaminyldiphosphoundecaprenol N-acetyl-beta-D-mannosaminyltransferase